MKVYIAGPMTGYKNFNRETFLLMAEELKHRGFEPIHTADMPDGLTYTAYINESLHRLRGCKAVYLLPRWYKSKGVIVELNQARLSGIPATESLAMLEQFRSEIKNGN